MAANANLYQAHEIDPHQLVPAWRRIAAGILRTVAVAIGLLAVLESIAATRWLILEAQTGARDTQPLFGVEVSLGQALLLGVVIEASVAGFLWLMACWIRQPNRPPQH